MSRQKMYVVIKTTEERKGKTIGRTEREILFVTSNKKQAMYFIQKYPHWSEYIGDENHGYYIALWVKTVDYYTGTELMEGKINIDNPFEIKKPKSEWSSNVTKGV